MKRLWKNNGILTLILFLQIGWIGVQSIQSPDTSTHKKRAKLLENFSSDKLEELSITGSESEAAKVVLERQDLQSKWRIREQEEYPANPVKVNRILRELTGLQIAEVVSTSSRHHIDLQVGDSSFRKKVILRNNDTEEILYFGKNGRGDSVHVRLQNDDTVYTVRNFSTWSLEAQPKAWLNPKYVDLEPEKIATFSLKTQDKSFQLRRQAGSNWTIEIGDKSPVPAESGKVTSFLQQLNSLKLKTVVGKASEHSERLLASKLKIEIGLEKSSVNIPEPAKSPTLSQEPIPIGTTLKLHLIAPSAEAEKYEMWLEGDEHVVTMDQESLNSILEVSQTSFFP